MGFLFKTKKNKYKTVAIFDIGSGSVGGAIVEIPTNISFLPVITSSFRIDIKTRSDSSFTEFMGSMLKSLDYISHKLLHEKAGRPEEVFCVLSSPWYISETRTIKLDRSIPFIFKRNVADKLLQKELSSLANSYKEKYGDDGVPDIIENNIISVYLDGKINENPIGKKCNSIQMNMFTSFSPSICINNIKNTIYKTFHEININFSSFPLSSYLAIRDKYVNSSSYLMVDISGEITDIGLVTDGILQSIISFPLGRKTFYKYLCDKLSIEQREAGEILSLYNNNNLIDKHHKKIVGVIKLFEKLWLESFSKSTSLLNNINIPKEIFITTDNDVKKVFVEILKDFKVETLGGGDFLDMCSVEGGPCDPFLMIDSISVMKKVSHRYNSIRKYE